MVTLLSLITAGFFLGMRHATDADHVIAISTIVARQRNIRNAALIGLLWGVGHTLTIAAVGGIIVFLGVVIPPRVGLAMEFAVAVMLVLLGLLNLKGVRRRIDELVGAASAKTHAHVHVHGDYAHSHSHGHEQSDHGHREEDTPQARLDRSLGRIPLYQALRPLVVGVVHGLAGSAGIALLVLTAIRDPWWAIGYLLIFGLGTIAGMMLVTSAIAVPMAYGAGRSPRFGQTLRLATGVVSLGFGLFLMLQIGIGEGLFTGAPSALADVAKH
jgi:high-affinity nickel-transport protein